MSCLDPWLGMPSIEVLPELTELTPVQRVRGHDMWLKRDDLFRIAGVNGGKARSCWQLAKGAAGLTTGSSRVSTQCIIVSSVAKELGIPCHVHTALGELTKELLRCQSLGAEVFQHYNGFSQNLASWAAKDAVTMDWTSIPFGMESNCAIHCTKQQVDNLPSVGRIVLSIGSGITAAGILWGLLERGWNIPVLGVRVGGGTKGSNLERRLCRYAPRDYNKMMEIVKATVPYDKHIDAEIGGVKVDPHYEAKVVEFLRPGDLFWIVGDRGAL